MQGKNEIFCFVYMKFDISLFSTNPAEDRAKHQMYITYPQHRVEEVNKMSDFMYMRQIGNINFCPMEEQLPTCTTKNYIL